jgi:hypothetical protein
MLSRKSSFPKWLEHEDAHNSPPGAVTAAASLCSRWYAWRAAGTASFLGAKLGGSEITISH